MKGKNILILVLLLFALVLGFILGKGGKGEERVKERIRTEVVTMYDTIKAAAPEPVHDTIVKWQAARVPIHHFREVTKMIKDTDSVDVTLPITQRTYRDSNYTAWVSGYQPRLDSIHTYNKMVYTTRTIERMVTKPPRKWGIGISAGYGYGINSKLFEPYIGIGVTYVIF
ncbi:DUF6808 domain-containing protein [Hoylesella loescheii]|uniref:DUF6808 domain-containing protein n=1 Tax=Hoylesella loescheii DSM 19665 = JCM 12249 = ATCC 15930 TaxID=1122985 RepID=A0A069QHP5_HOYLO|nr:hypothetical protein [Hoylesella loescheii]KDR52383.1 hypothetical protein HMPREF1991_01566 [Hoylesella loescheii DSM 19665 = JCM 12249 = ATCC 15930]